MALNNSMKRYLKNFKDFVNESISDDDIESVFGDLGLYSLTQDQMDFLDRYTEGKWSYDRYTNVVDIDGSFNASESDIFDFLGINFRRVTGDFLCDSNPNLTSLNGAPKKVGRDFECYDNPGLTSLEGAPDWVGGNFYCNNNPRLRSLEGIGEVKGEIYSELRRLTNKKIKRKND